MGHRLVTEPLFPYTPPMRGQLAMATDTEDEMDKDNQHDELVFYIENAAESLAGLVRYGGLDRAAQDELDNLVADLREALTIAKAEAQS